MATANKRVVYVGGLADEVDEKVIQVNCDVQGEEVYIPMIKVPKEFIIIFELP